MRFHLFRAIGATNLAVRQLPVFSISFVVASRSFKVGSSALEAGALLATWLVLDGLVEGVIPLVNRPRPALEDVS